MTIIDFLEECGVNPVEKIDREGDSYWRLNELIEHYVQDVINSSEIIRHVSDTSFVCENSGTSLDAEKYQDGEVQITLEDKEDRVDIFLDKEELKLFRMWLSCR